MKCKALIISINGVRLSQREKALLSNEKPWGVILFKRNLQSFDQIKKLTSEIRFLTKNKSFPILIDEEGLSVSRLRKLIDHNFSSYFFGNLFKVNKALCTSLFKQYIKSLCSILRDLGININTIPVLDILRNNTNKIIGSRSFSKEKKIVKELGALTLKYLHANKVAGVIKHIPGHGGSRDDSHKKMPKVSISLSKLNEIDFFPFKSSKAKLAMTAHILYTNLDRKNVATFSQKIINKTIRKKIGYKGILISDDISMKALKYDLITNAKKSLDAGCNIVLYCSGNIDDNYKLIKSLPYIDEFTIKKTSEFFKFLR